ncbi:hypothetical protein L3X38_018749 [Prunus dulcis]|uniref:Agglutinin domain-containing protein n=1 Tax=Prunus dulcis TaxID=3755 RepID=A0AAD4WBV3_PRUDU|nr:uncharacterized protein LOC117621822 [Prunus dulcis]KAI5339477.1 hypothetical protein L3X38_018749 [Prunus dulcis]
MAKLPEFIALESVKNRKYLVYKHQPTIPKLPNFLQCSGQDSHSKDARFKVEKDVNDPSLVHIKCTYNDKYLRLESQHSSWIVADADKKQPNKTLWSCTLFKPEGLEFPGLHGLYKFIHVYTEKPIGPKSEPLFEDVLAVESAKPSEIHAFIVEKLPG